MTSRIIAISGNRTTTLLLGGEATEIHKKSSKTIVTQTRQGPPGPAGESVASLEPRITALEENTDGLVGGADPLSYYILARGT